MPKKSNTDKWRELLTHPHSAPLAWLPRSPRCSLCGIPFAGFGGLIAQTAGWRRWNKNPTLCNQCFRGLPGDGIEVDVAVLFADMRGSTALGEQLSPSAFAELLNRFYTVSIEVLAPSRAIIDKMIGDEVMAFFVAMTSREYRQNAVAAAIEMMRRFPEVIPEEQTPRLGIGLNAGLAYVGKVGQGEVADFTALGDTVNAASRLQQEAGPGEIIMSEDLYRTVAGTYPRLEQRTLELRGRHEPMAVRVLGYRDLAGTPAPGIA